MRLTYMRLEFFFNGLRGAGTYLRMLKQNLVFYYSKPESAALILTYLLKKVCETDSAHQYSTHILI